MRDRTHAVQAREVLEVRALVVDSRSACVAVGSPPPGARACARARLREARIFPFASGRPFSSSARGGRSSDSPTRALATIGPPRGRVRVSRRLFAHTTVIFLPSRRASVPVRKPPPRASHRVARGASRFAASLVPRRLLPALRTRASKAASRPAEMGSTMHATQAQLKDAKVDLAYRDFCAHLLIPLNGAGRPTTSSGVRARPPRVREVPVQSARARARARATSVRLTNPPPPRPAPAALRKSWPQIDRS